MEIEELQKQEEAEAGEEEDGLLGSRGMYGNGESRRGKRWDVKGFVIIALVVSNICLASALVFSRRSDSASTGGGDTSNNVAIVPQLPSKLVEFRWRTPYSSPNDTEADALWDAISPAHGHIAVDHKWAKEHNWRESMSVPGTNGTKGLYLLESYHQLHCLRIVRKVLLQLVNGSPPSYPIQHARHCLDYFRQFVMCHADNTPLYTIGDHTAGNGQIHLCRDWDALRDYATESSACFHDRVGFETLEEQFGHCDGGNDGVAASVDLQNE